MASSSWPAVKAKRLVGALLRIGWMVKRTSGSHRTLARPGWPDYTFAFHDNQGVGPKVLASIARKTGLRPEDL
jgi:predicted RNA binding protein YcfA (HicA-like mRNA interferase family)